MAVCSWCNGEMTTAISCVVSAFHKKGHHFDMIPFGAEPGRRASGDRCGDCGVLRGGWHHPGCDLQRCPACRSHALFRSRGKTVLDRLHKQVTEKRLHRCQKCGWRGWTQSLDVSLHYSLPVHVPALDRLETAFAIPSRGQRAS